ncbi:Flp family type IVb pilin [Arthrobacter sp. TB 26]|uniref:Flp family type IVb pilin n=1 Tax=Arthrobacter sp. TB 26 TaxID=494420 RepID=UPI00041BB6D7|nr:Flp family type IVb pilin [Arthrobacter sp. TB 26]
MSRIAARVRRQLDDVRTRFISEEAGATATEYSILVGFIAIVIVAGVGAFGTALNVYFNGLSDGVRAALGLP